MNLSLQRKIQNIVDDAIARGEELGVQCIIWKDGAIQAEYYAGYCDEERLRPVKAESLFPVFSVGKAFFSTLALKLVETGVVGLDMPLAEVWPEFGTKELRAVLLRHVLNHTTGLFIMPQASTPEELSDWELMCARMARRRPAWTPGTKTQYQALTYSWLLGGTLVHATGKPLGELLRKELLEPIGVEQDTFFGIPLEEEHRLGRVVHGPDLLSSFPKKQTYLDPLPNSLRCRCVRAACLPAFNCLSDVRGMAKFGAELWQGHIISRELLAEATTLQRPVNDPIPSENLDEYWTIFGYGYTLLGGCPDYGRIFGHHGHGGSEITIDQENGTVFAVVKNRLSGKVLQPMKEKIRREVRQVLHG